MTTVPLSWIQQRMLDIPLAGDPAVHVTQVVLPAAQPVPDRLRAAWDHAGARFAALRTSLAWSATTQPELIVGARPQPLGEHEVDHPIAELQPWLDRRAELTGLFSGRRLTRLDLARHGDEAAVVFTFNHLVLDGWSMSLVLRKLAGAPVAATGSPAPAPAPAPAVPDEHDLLFWTRLSQAGTEIPVRGTRRARTDRELAADTTAALYGQARAARVTPAALLHVVFALAVARVAAPFAPRMTTAMSVRGDADTHAVGNYLAALPFAIDLPPRMPLCSLLPTTQALLAEMHARAPSYPGVLARGGGPPGRPTVWFSAGSFPVPGLGSGRTPYSVERPAAPLSLFAEFAEPGDRLRFQVVRRGDPAGLDHESLADAVVTVCALVAADGTRPLADFLG
jgi:hypothetical protein